MNITELQAQCVGLHLEIEALGQKDKTVKEEMMKQFKLYQSLKIRKREVKEAIELNLNQQEAFWEENKVSHPQKESLTAIEDFFADPNQSLQEVATRHNISISYLSRQLSAYLISA